MTPRALTLRSVLAAVRSPHISLYLSYLPTSPYIALRLPTSPYITLRSEHATVALKGGNLRGSTWAGLGLR